MTPISVVCETCGAKLKVRDPDAMGQIHACPRCESMVMIAVPTELTDPKPATSASNSSSSELVEGLVAPSDFGAEIDDLLADPPQDTPVETTVDSLAEAASNTAVADQSVESTSIESEAKTEIQPTSEVRGQEPPTEEFLGANNPTWTNWAVPIGGSVACFALGLLAAWWMMGDNTDPSEQELASAGQMEADPAEPADDASNTIKVQKPVTPQLLPAEPSPPSALNKRSGEETKTNQEDNSDRLPALPPVVPHKKPENGSSEATPEAPEVLQPLDPLGIDSANLDLLFIPVETPQERPNTPPVESVASAPSVDKPKLPQVAPPPRKLRFEPGSASQGPSYSENWSEGKLEVRLNGLLPGISWRNAPLHVALGELSQLSGVPITIDPDALRMAGVSATRRVSVDAADSSVRDVALELAAKVKLVTEPSPTGLVLAKKWADRWRDYTYRELDDLCPSDGDATELAALLKRFVEPNSWDDEDAKIETSGKQLNVNQTTRVHYELLIFCERLRKARGQVTRTKYPSTRISIEPRLAQLKESLDHRTTFAFVDWTSLSEVFSYWQDSSGMVLLVDWQHLADMDLRPMATLAASVDNTKWRDAIETSLSTLKLDWVPVDGTTLRITTRDQAELDCWVEFYPGADARKLRDAIESQADATALAGMVIAEDVSERFVIVRGNRRVHELALTQKR